MTNSTVEAITLNVRVPSIPGGVFPINPTIYKSKDEVILFDTGFPGSEELIIEQLAKCDLTVVDLTGIVLTHEDIDHVGSISALLIMNPNITVYAHELDRPYIEGQKPLSKGLPGLMAEQFSGGYIVPPTPVVDKMLVDGDQLGDLVVIHTPGHTEGHMSFYHKPSKTLVAADAMVIRGPQLQGPNPMQTPDKEAAYKSLDKFANFDIERIICYHGGVYESATLNDEIAQIATTGPVK